MDNTFRQGELFPDFISQITEPASSAYNSTVSTKRGEDFFYEEICRHLTFTSEFQHPKIEAVTSTLNYGIVAYHRCSSLSTRNVCPHFYTSDSNFIYALRHPRRTLTFLQHYPCVIGPDISVWPTMVRSTKERNIFLNKMFTAWWQYNGIIVYPNVVWSERLSKELCFDGFPTKSIIAVNSTGIGRDHHAQKVWINGYNAMLEILQPIHIIRYGAKQEGENEGISTYFPNDNWRATHHGW